MVYMTHPHLKIDQPELLDRVGTIVQKGNSGLVTNIDGVLSTLAITPDEAEVSSVCREALSKLVQTGKFLLIAVISGRSAEEGRRLVGLDSLHYIGNNGLEVLTPGNPAAVSIKAARPYHYLVGIVLETIEHNLRNFYSEELIRLEGKEWYDKLVFENKGLSASVHYRRFNNQEVIKQFLLEKIGRIAGEVGLNFEEEAASIEIRPPVKVNKNTAITTLCEVYYLNNLVYLGSDLADVEAIQALHHLAQDHIKVKQEVILDWPEFTGLSIGVSNPETPPELIEAADFLVEGIEGVEKFLTGLVDNLN